MNARSVVPAVALDVILVLIFATMGRNSHELGMTFIGVLATAWPFLVGLAVMWAVLRAWRNPVDPIRTGVPLWVGTVILGMLLRILVTDAQFVLPFFLVAAGTIGLMLVGWRALSALIRRRNVKTPA